MRDMWRRVSKKVPCPVCGKPDWCCIGDHFINCMRVQNDRPAKNGGWLHKLDTQLTNLPPKERRQARINAEKMIEDWLRETRIDHLIAFGEKLGVTGQSLNFLCCAWAPIFHAWAFPMRDGYGHIVGIRLRSENGFKWSVTGSREGIFLPIVNWGRVDTVLICEGPTDAAAGLDLGYFTIGRPSCASGVETLQIALRRLHARAAIIIADNDSEKTRADGKYWYPGQEGAERLSVLLPCPTCVFLPPAKDLREFIRMGGSRKMIDSTIAAARWTQPKEHQ